MHANTSIGCQENCRVMKKQDTKISNLRSPQFHHQQHQTKRLDSAEPPSPILKTRIPLTFQFPPVSSATKQTPTQPKTTTHSKTPQIPQNPRNAATLLAHKNSSSDPAPNAALPTTIQSYKIDPAKRSR